MVVNQKDAPVTGKNGIHVAGSDSESTKARTEEQELR